MQVAIHVPWTVPRRGYEPAIWQLLLTQKMKMKHNKYQSSEGPDGHVEERREECNSRSANSKDFLQAQICIISPSLTTPSEATEKRSVRTSHRYEFRVLLHCTKPPSRTRASPVPKGERKALAREGGSSAKSKLLAGEPYSSYLWLARTLPSSAASAVESLAKSEIGQHKRQHERP